MRCHSVQALWASTPPSHHVVSIAALQNPPSLWTGGTRGDIIYWKLPPFRPPIHPSHSSEDLWPVALLCGHTAEVADLVACKLNEDVENIMNRNDATDREEELDFYDIVVSACIEGWLCSWDSLTGRCRRRRKLPPWVGNPHMMKTISTSKRYIVIACDGSVRGAYTSPCRNDIDTNRTTGAEKSAILKKDIRGTIIIVDSLSLAIVQVIFHGTLGIGPVRALVVLPEVSLSQKLIVSDHTGQIRAWNIALHKHGKSEEEDEQLSKVTSSRTRSETDFTRSAKAISLSMDGLYALLVFNTHWVVVFVEDQNVVYESTWDNDYPPDSACVGGLFLAGYSNPMNGERRQTVFLIWDSHGGAVAYSMHVKLAETVIKELFRFPPIVVDPELQYTAKYYQLYESIVCVTCSYSSVEMPDTLVRLWALPCSIMNYLDFKDPEISLNNGYCTLNGTSRKEVNFIMYKDCSLSTYWSNIRFSDLPGENRIDVKGLPEKPLLVCKGGFSEWVTSSMVLFDKLSTPSTFVLGFNSGNIRLIWFRMTLKGRERNGQHSDGCVVQCLFKHTGPVICLAELHLCDDETSVLSMEKRFLISGGMDCLTCIWDMENDGELLMILHHHVTPVLQILLPPLGTYAPWSNCFITVGEDGCMALISVETLQVERMFVGHPARPRMISWDGIRGYLACLCDAPINVLFVWDIKSGALERVLRGVAAHSMYDHFTKHIRGASIANALFDIQATSIASLLHGDTDSPNSSSDHVSIPQSSAFNVAHMEGDFFDWNISFSGPKSDEMSSNKMAESFGKISIKLSQVLNQGAKTVAVPSHPKKHNGFGSTATEVSNRDLFHKQPPIRGVSPFPGVLALQFDLFTLMAPDLGRLKRTEREQEPTKLSIASSHFTDNQVDGVSNEMSSSGPGRNNGGIDLSPSNAVDFELLSTLGSSEGSLLCISLEFLHLWGANLELDNCLQKELRIVPPVNVGTAVGFAGDRGTTTLLLPGWKSTFEMWKSSSEFCALRSLTIVATALRMTTLSRLTSNANSALAAFYTRGLVEKFPQVKAPSLELYACFWQDPSEHVRMAARSLFHCAASRAIPSVLSAKGAVVKGSTYAGDGQCSNIDTLLTVEQKIADECAGEKATWPDSVSSSSEIVNWLELYEGQPWTEVIGGTSQDGKASRIIVAGALSVWYPCLIRPEVAPSVAPYLVKLVKAVVDRHSAVAAELLADGMENVWRHLIAREIPSLISDIFLLIECLAVGGATKANLVSNPATAVTIRETLTGSLLPSLAMVDVSSFLQIVQSQLSSASPDSPVHLVTLMTLIRIIRGAPREVVHYLPEVVSVILHTMNEGKHCYQTAMAAAKEMVRVFPMVAFHQASGKLAVGEATGDVHSLAIHVYDINSPSKPRILDASGPPGHPALRMGEDSSNTGGISALHFSEDGEGVVAFSQHGLMIRWWSLNSAWWEKFSRVAIPIQCNKLLLVPPWSGFSPKSSCSSIMATISDDTEEIQQGQSHNEAQGRLVGQCIDLSFRLEWRQGKKVALLHHMQELGVFQL